MPSWRSNQWGLPNPDSCAVCDADKRVHAIIWNPAAGWHNWVEPTDEVRLQRMKAIRYARLTDS